MTTSLCSVQVPQQTQITQRTISSIRNTQTNNPPASCAGLLCNIANVLAIEMTSNSVVAGTSSGTTHYEALEMSQYLQHLLLPCLDNSVNDTYCQWSLPMSCHTRFDRDLCIILCLMTWSLSQAGVETVLGQPGSCYALVADSSMQLQEAAPARTSPPAISTASAGAAKSDSCQSQQPSANENGGIAANTSSPRSAATDDCPVADAALLGEPEAGNTAKASSTAVAAKLSSSSSSVSSVAFSPDGPLLWPCW